MIREQFTVNRWRYAAYSSKNFQVLEATSPKKRQYQFLYDNDLDLLTICIVNAKHDVIATNQDFFKCISKIPIHVLIWVSKMVEGLVEVHNK